MPCVAKGTETRLLSSQNHKPVALKSFIPSLHQKPLTQYSFNTKRLFTPETVYTKQLHQKVFTLHQELLAPNSFCTRRFLATRSRLLYTFMPKKKLGTRRSTKGHAKQTALSVPLLSNSVLRYNRPNDRFSSKNGPLIKIGTVWNDMHTVIENRM